mmetsp:Transcript_48470/g.157097  ORF Transcript_48470/g.157097 Transcript_48470/m.157097 type:complete len:225 (-) Transcript_48470:333-1007(-)
MPGGAAPVVRRRRGACRLVAKQARAPAPRLELVVGHQPARQAARVGARARERRRRLRVAGAGGAERLGRLALLGAAVARGRAWLGRQGGGGRGGGHRRHERADAGGEGAQVSRRRAQHPQLCQGRVCVCALRAGRRGVARGGGCGEARHIGTMPRATRSRFCPTATPGCRHLISPASACTLERRASERIGRQEGARAARRRVDALSPTLPAKRVREAEGRGGER